MYYHVVHEGKAGLTSIATHCLPAPRVSYRQQPSCQSHQATCHTPAGKEGTAQHSTAGDAAVQITEHTHRKAGMGPVHSVAKRSSAVAAIALCPE